MERGDAIHAETDHARGVSNTSTVVIFGILALSGLLGYLIGSIPVANLVAHRSAGVDLRTVGDQNPGFWNAMQTLGGRASTLVFIGDAAKGLIAALIPTIIAMPLSTAVVTGVSVDGDDRLWWIGYAAVGAAMVGHAFPVFAGFRGGRSVLTFAGGMMLLAPLSAAGAIAVVGLYAAASRRVPQAIRIGVAAFPVIQILIEGPYPTAATGVLMTFIGLRFAMAARSTPAPSNSDAAEESPER
jgi:glycerol-3-phosphate acyltransferase PlsY